MRSDILITGLKHLETLDLQSIKLIEIVKLAGRGFDSKLSLSLKGAPNLELIDLQDNKIETLNYEFYNEIEHSRTQGSAVQIDLSGNPLLCDCSTQSFVAWPHAWKHVFVNRNQTQCRSINDQFLMLDTLSYTSLQHKCIHMDIILSVASELLNVIIIFLLTLAYRARLRLLYKCFTCQQKISRRLCPKQDQLDDTMATTDYEYDAFVSYSSERFDRYWVHDVLMKILEETYGFRLVIH